MSRNPLCFYGPYHLFQNITNGIIFGSGGAGWQGGCLNIEILRTVAEASGCDLAKRIAHQTVDKHAHTATFFFIAHSGMHAQLRAMASRAGGKADEATKEGRLQDAAMLRAEEQDRFLDAAVM